MSEKRLLRASGGHSSIECCGIFDVRVVVGAGHLKTGGEGDRHTTVRPRLASCSSDLIYLPFTTLLVSYCTLLVATVRHKPEQMLGHVLGHALEQTRLCYGA